jgi:hypothetical protein
MHRLGVCLVLFLAISGCNYSRPHAPAEATELESRAAEFRHRVLRRNVETVIDNLISKLETKWLEHNQVIYDFALYKLRLARDTKLKDADLAGTQKAYSDYEQDLDKLTAQFKKANQVNSEKLAKFKADILTKLQDQFDRSEQADIILMRYMMGLQPGPFDSFLIGEPDIIQQDKLDAVLPKKE